MDPAQYSSKAFAACFFAAANSLFLISESFLMSLAIIPSSFKFRSGSDGEIPRRCETKFLVFRSRIIPLTAA